MIDLSARQTDTGDVELTYTAGDPGATLYTVHRDDGGGEVPIGFTPPTSLAFIDPAGGLTDGTTYTYRVSSDAPDTSPGVAVVYTVGEDFTFGPVDFLPAGPRYTTLETVKRRLGIDPLNTDRDADITESIVAAETTIDAYLGRSFPDTGDNPEIPGIPEAVRAAATQAAVRVYKESDRAGLSAGSEDWFGTIDAAGATIAVIENNPVLVGLRASFGIA